ncbi:1-acyl-sn-glycerol-3-phosphate acyltransferase [Deinococcus sonorensis]|uniref:1-acyl-sn-glycerol-3-phosphate acyltransferase n=2 Tax=Deinococcus sonorensis TaxID=309891 RepID=A0AAU7UDJ6_9DEIO
MTRQTRAAPLGHRGWRALARLLGWTVVYVPPPNQGRKAVLVAYPHTSNWDFLPAMLMRAVVPLPLHWIGKHSLFRGPMGGLMRWLGGVSLDRRQVGGNFTEAVATLIRDSDQMLLALSAEGTRARADHWRSGFYYIALKAQVPIGLCYIDWRRREVGIGGYLQPSGNIEQDFGKFELFFQDVTGRHPERQTPVILRPSDPESPQ